MKKNRWPKFSCRIFGFYDLAVFYFSIASGAKLSLASVFIIPILASSPSLSNNYPAVVSPSTGGMGGARAPMMGYPERNQYSYDFY